MIKVLYAGGAKASALLLEELLEAQGDYKIVAVLTVPPASRGRHKELIPSEVAMIARARDIPVIEALHLDADTREQVAQYGADMMICFAYGHIFGPKFLSLFKVGAVNMHPSLLPKYRGASPVQCAILNGDKDTGVSIQKIALECDSGDIISRVVVPIGEDEKTQDLLFRCTHEGVKLLKELLKTVCKTGALPPATPQTGEVSVCPLFTKEDGHIDWGESAIRIYRRLRAFSPWPGLYTISYSASEGKRLNVLDAKCATDEEIASIEGFNSAPKGAIVCCSKDTGIVVKAGEGAIKILKLQWQGHRALLWNNFINGSRGLLGTVLE